MEEGSPRWEGFVKQVVFKPGLKQWRSLIGGSGEWTEKDGCIERDEVGRK